MKKKRIKEKEREKSTRKRASSKTDSDSRTVKGGPAKKTTDLSVFREKIDRIDDKLLDLLNKRAKLAIKIGHAKASSNMSFYSPKRERQIFERLSKGNPGPFPNEAIRAVFREIISASLSLEKPLMISFLGPRATFTHLACMEYFGRSSHFVPERNIRDVFEGVERERVDYGVIPIENSTEGVIGYTLDLFMECEVRISAEILLDISLDLLSRADGIKDIRRVYSHPHALAQCRKWIDSHLKDVEVIDVESTARAAEIASSEVHSAAVASSFAGEVYDLRVLERRVQDNPFNFTRFLVIGKHDAEPSGNDRTSLMFALKDSVGALHSALKPFSDNDVNLTKIESRPHKKRAWDYIFFVDTEGHHTDSKFKAALEAFMPVCRNVKILGSYPSGREKGFGKPANLKDGRK